MITPLWVSFGVFPRRACSPKVTPWTRGFAPLKFHRRPLVLYDLSRLFMTIIKKSGLYHLIAGGNQSIIDPFTHHFHNNSSYFMIISQLLQSLKSLGNYLSFSFKVISL